jgi:hypothetical protein
MTTTESRPTPSIWLGFPEFLYHWVALPILGLAFVFTGFWWFYHTNHDYALADRLVWFVVGFTVLALLVATAANALDCKLPKILGG